MLIAPVIRPATLADAAPLAVFAGQAFTDTYQEISDPDEIADYVAEHFRPEVMAAVLADPACTTLLAELDGQLAGYAILHDTSPPPCVVSPEPLKLWRLYLARQHTGQGLGSQLMASLQAHARSRGVRTLWLSVYDRNEQAVRFYERQGFAKVGGLEFLFGGEIYIDPVYAVAVSPAGTP